MHIYNEITNDNISIEKIEEDQKQFKYKLNEITTGNIKHKSRDKVIKLYKLYYAKIISEAIYKTK